MRRRSFLGLLFLPVCFASQGKTRTPYEEVIPGRHLRFPRDDGAHPGFRTEWWYVTGWLDGPMGFQVTFFRVRPEGIDEANPSAFNPRQVLLAHAALADPRIGHLVHDERAARAGFGLAGAEEGRTHAWIGDWQLEQQGDRYHARIHAQDPGLGLQLDLNFSPGKLLLQGEQGFSRKGRGAEEASYYYSRSHLSVVGQVNGRAAAGEAWLDHEWSSAYLPEGAVGWDWCGINLFDGGSLMAFRMRNHDGSTNYAPPGVAFEVLRTWKSPRTAVDYPVEMQVHWNEGKHRRIRLQPLMEDQELDARSSTGTIYWEGAVRAFENDREVGRGYLELTGYWKPMKL